MIIFGTFANINYLTQLLALIESFLKHTTYSKMCVVAIDDETYHSIRFLDFPRVELFKLEELENCLPSLEFAKNNRSISEYFFTLTSAIPNFLLIHYPNADFVTYVDADLFFYSNPEIILEKCSGEVNVLLTPHNFANINSNLYEFGEFNTGFVAFRVNSAGNKVATWWFESCLNWCKDVVDNGKYADQKYLESFKTIVDGVEVCDEFGLNLGPWGLNNLKYLSASGDITLVNNQTLYAYHFSGLKINSYFVILGCWPYNHRISRVTFDLIYRDYLESLRKWNGILLTLSTNNRSYLTSRSLRSTRKVSLGVIIRALLSGDIRTRRRVSNDSIK